MRAAATLALVAVVLLLLLCPYVSGVSLPRIREINSTSSNWTVTLEVDVHRHTSSQVNFTSRQYCYEGVCGVPGPVLRFKPGDTVTLTLRNRMAALPIGLEAHHNSFHSPNETNLHTHGLHVSANEDRVLDPVIGGEDKVYVYHIYDTHAPGTHWYHSHLHGASALHMAGGMVGALIMEASAAATVPAALLGAESSIIVMTAHKFNNQQVVIGNLTLDVQDCKFGDGYDGQSFAGQHTGSYGQLTEQTGSLVPAAATFANDSTPRELILANGEFAPTLDLKQSQQHILRMVHANGMYSLDMRVPGCTMDVIAADGVYYSAFRRAAMVSFTSGCRYDVLVTCPATGTYPVLATFGQPLERINQTLLVLNVTSSGGAAATTLTSAALATITRPDYLQSLMNASAVDKLDVSFIPTDLSALIGDGVCGNWMGTGPDCSGTAVTGLDTVNSSTDLSCRYQQFAGAQGGDGSDASPPPSTQQYHFVTSLGRVNEWRIYGFDDHWHPFHLHVYHFQIVAFEPSDAWPAGEDWTQYISVGEWRDTIPIFPGRIVVRFQPLHYGGETVMHCHWLAHEDTGMMSTVYVCNDGVAGNSVGCPAANIAHAAASATVVTTAAQQASGTSYLFNSPVGVIVIVAAVLVGVAIVACTAIFCARKRAARSVPAPVAMAPWTSAPAATAAAPGQVVVHV